MHFEFYIHMSSKIPGHATSEGTARYKSRFSNLHPDHFRERHSLWFSSIGIGSYLGEPDEETDQGYEASLKEAVLAGVNVIDSAINYRAQRSERSFGKALRGLIQARKIRRDEIIVCTKGGFIPFDGEYPSDPRGYFQRAYFDPGIIKPEEVVQGCHVMTPRYLEDQLERSLDNLGLETIDIYYLHNPETQLSELKRAEFLDRLRRAFSFLEKKVREGKIRMYGAATWNGFRVPQGGEGYLSLEEMTPAAREAGGPGNHFKAIQLPVNLVMPEAWVFPNQPYGAQSVPFLGRVNHFQMIAIASASLLQARLTRNLPDFLDPYFKNLKQCSQRALQFARSVPGITTALVGMKNPVHVQENLETAKVPRLTEPELVLMFSKSGG